MDPSPPTSSSRRPSRCSPSFPVPLGYHCSGVGLEVPVMRTPVPCWDQMVPTRMMIDVQSSPTYRIWKRQECLLECALFPAQYLDSSNTFIQFRQCLLFHVTRTYGSHLFRSLPELFLLQQGLGESLKFLLDLRGVCVIFHDIVLQHS